MHDEGDVSELHAFFRAATSTVAVLIRVRSDNNRFFLNSEQGISGYAGNIVTTDSVFESSLGHGCMCEC